MENGRRDAFDLAREALLARYGTLDADRLRATGADEVEVGAAAGIVKRDGNGLTREKRFILACPPTNINELMAGQGLPQYMPTVDHTLRQCEDCRQDTERPKAAGGGESSTGTTLVPCMACAVVESRKRGGGDGRPRLLR